MSSCTHERVLGRHLRRKIVEAVGRGTSKAEAARLFGVSLSSVKRYARAAREGRRPLAPKKRHGSSPKIGGDAKGLLLEADLEERPAATLEERREEYLAWRGRPGGCG